MRKLLVLALALALVFSMSGIGMAIGSSMTATTDSQGITAEILKYYAVQFNPRGIDKYGNDIVGLFGAGGSGFELTGAPGIYVSDGTSTLNRVKVLWGPALGVAPDGSPDEFLYPSGTSPNTVDVFTVDANCAVDVTLTADFTGWMNAPTLIRVSSSENDPSYIHGIGNWSDQLAEVRNTVNYVANPAYNAMIDAHNALSLDNEFPLDFSNDDPGYLCYGPIEFHVNAAVWLPKISMVAADTYNAEVTVTVAPQ